MIVAQSNFAIRKAVQTDLDGIKALADAHKHELGFVLRPALAESIARGEVFVATNGARLVGFVDYRHRRDTQTTLYHIAVALDWRQRDVGQRLIKALKTEAAEQGKQNILLKCPEDLPANGFYERLGFSLIANESGRRRKLNVWRLTIGKEM